MEEARALGELLPQGWRPARRSSTPPGTARNRDCSVAPSGPNTTPTSCGQKAVAYINTDSNGRGFLEWADRTRWSSFMNEVARDITDPETGLSVWKRMQLRAIQTGSTGKPDARRAREATSGSTPWARVRLHPVPAASPDRLAQPRVTAGRTAAGSTIPSTTISAGLPLSAIPPSPTGRRCRRRWERR